jgi:hypothetical protein
MDKIEVIKSLKILVDGVRAKVDFQLNADNGLDTKTATLLGLIGAIAVFYISTTGSYCYISLIPLFTLAISAYFLLQALATKEYNTGLIDVYDDTKGYRSMGEYDLLNQLLSDYQKAFDDNSKVLKDKNQNYKNAVSIFLFSILLMIIFNFI